jgi:dihydrofolate synthase/folylpolyglutamate synthase
MEATADSLRLHFDDRKVIFIVGVMADKDVDAMMAYIAPLAKVFLTVKPDHERAMDAHELKKRLKRFGVPVVDCDSVSSGVSEAFNLAGEKGVICALGSLFFSAEIRAAYAEYMTR